MDRVEIESKVKELISEVLMMPEENIKNSDDIATEYGADEVDFAEMAIQVEEYFGFIPEVLDFESIETVQQFIDYVADKKGI